MSDPTFVTLGPAGTCHENALIHYLEFQGIQNAQIVLVEDLLEQGLEIVRSRAGAFMVQCSAHLQVHLVTERHHDEVFVVDSFVYPTKELALLVRADVENPRSLGIVDATKGYTDLDRFQTIIEEPSKPIVAEGLLEGRYDAGLTHAHHLAEHPEHLRLVESYGAVDTSWVVYGSRKRFVGEVIGQRTPWLLAPEQAMASTGVS